LTLAADWRALGTDVRVAVTEQTGLAEARRAVEACLDSFDLACSRFRSDSELCALNRAPGRWVTVSALLMKAVDAALWAAEVTEGAVDPTVGRALRAVGYDRDFAAVPASAGPIRVRLRPVPGWQAVELDPTRSRIRLAPGTELDLGSSAKALAADRAAEAAREALGPGGALVCVGGDIAVRGDPPAPGWIVLVAEDSSVPLDSEGEVVTILDGGIATSSTWTRRWTRGGVELHHIIDPATGAPCAGPWRTATVAAASCLQANAAATAAIVMGDRALGWLAEQGLPARLVSQAGEVVATASWPAAPAAR
jgi:thiamine biosynthesis lipoprotein ApbE